MKKIYLILLIAVFLSGCASISGPISGKKFGNDFNKRQIGKFYSYVYPEYKQECRQYYINNHPDLKKDIKSIILEGKLKIGMSAEQVIASIGNPEDVNTTVTEFGTNEQWIYGFTGVNASGYYVDNSQYIYFDNGKLTTIQK